MDTDDDRSEDQMGLCVTHGIIRDWTIAAVDVDRFSPLDPDVWLFTFRSREKEMGRKERVTLADRHSANLHPAVKRLENGHLIPGHQTSSSVHI